MAETRELLQAHERLKKRIYDWLDASGGYEADGTEISFARIEANCAICEPAYSMIAAIMAAALVKRYGKTARIDSIDWRGLVPSLPKLFWPRREPSDSHNDERYAVSNLIRDAIDTLLVHIGYELAVVFFEYMSSEDLLQVVTMAYEEGIDTPYEEIHFFAGEYLLEKLGVQHND